jgi:hypothetical protein
MWQGQGYGLALYLRVLFAVAVVAVVVGVCSGGNGQARRAGGQIDTREAAETGRGGARRGRPLAARWASRGAMDLPRGQSRCTNRWGAAGCGGFLGDGSSRSRQGCRCARARLWVGVKRNDQAAYGGRAAEVGAGETVEIAGYAEEVNARYASRWYGGGACRVWAKAGAHTKGMSYRYAGGYL